MEWLGVSIKAKAYYRKWPVGRSSQEVVTCQSLPGSKASCSLIPGLSYFPYVPRDGPLEKLWGRGGEFSSCRNIFSLSNSLYEFFF